MGIVSLDFPTTAKSGRKERSVLASSEDAHVGVGVGVESTFSFKTNFVLVKWPREKPCPNIPSTTRASFPKGHSKNGTKKYLQQFNPPLEK